MTSFPRKHMEAGTGPGSASESSDIPSDIPSDIAPAPQSRSGLSAKSTSPLASGSATVAEADPMTVPDDRGPEQTVIELEREFVLLSRLLVALRSKYRYQLERAHYVILVLLEEKGPLTIGTIAQTLLLDNSTASRQIAAMERMELATRVEDPSDQRRAIVCSTAKGREMMAEMRALRTRDTEFIISDWNAEDRECFTRLLTRFNRTLIRKLSGKEPQWSQEDAD